MTHRAGRIVTAAAAILGVRIQPKGYHVYEHRRMSLDPEQDELPAVSVDYGPDEPQTEVTGIFRSRLTLHMTAIAVSPDELLLQQILLELRREIHVAMMQDDVLGLDFVETTLYGGAAEPEFGTRGSKIVGALTSDWIVQYVMPLADPA